MKPKLKYINLFENLLEDDIPYSYYDGESELSVEFPENIKNIDSIFNQITNQIYGYLLINNTQINIINNFDNLEEIGGIIIDENYQLKSIEGFDMLYEITGLFSIKGNDYLNIIKGFKNLNTIGEGLYVSYNGDLIIISIPSTLIKSVNYDESYIEIEDDYRFKSPEEFVNSDIIIQDCIDKFDPLIHSDVVVRQLCDNLELWGTDETKERVYSHIAPYCTPEQLELLPEMYRYLHDLKYKNTGAKSVAKVATGITYGLF